jgi:pyruvate dehydrogenase E2 component (dihydrolipoamide acetyltransferase)
VNVRHEMTGAAPADPGPRMLDVAGRRIRHRVLGHGADAVVLVHGFGGCLENWASNQAALAAGGRTVAAFDLPGHGESDVDVGSGSLDDLAAVLIGYLDAAGLGRVHLVGHSMGAALCLVAADREPTRVRSLALIGPAGLGQKIDAGFIRGYVAAQGHEALGKLLGMLYADPSRITADDLEQAVEYKRRDGVTGALLKIASSRYGRTPSGRALHEVAGTVPTLAIWGAADAIIPPPVDFDRPGVELHVLPGCGHMVQVESADEVNRLIDAFLRH